MSTERQDRLPHQYPRNERQVHPENTYNTYISHYWQYTPYHQHQMTGPRQFTHNNRPYKDQNLRDKTSQFIEVQNEFTETLHKTQVQNSKNTFMNDLRTYTAYNQKEFDT